MRWSPRMVRVGLIGVFVVPAFVVAMTSALQAQPRPPIGQPPRPPIGPIGGPKIERVWTCGKCKREIGRGIFPPGQCPHCGVKIINGHGPANPPINPIPPFNPNPNPPFNPNPNPPFNPPPEIAPPPAAPAPIIGGDTAPAEEAVEAPAPARFSTGVIVLFVAGIVLVALVGIAILGIGVYMLVMRTK